MAEPMRLLYCNCTYAQVVPKEVKEAVLRKLCESGVAFEAVADLCEMSARRDPALQRLAAGGAIKIAACYPRAVKWLFAAAHTPLAENGAEVLNMRIQSAEEVTGALLSSGLKPNLPSGKATAPNPVAEPSTATPADSGNPFPVGADVRRLTFEDPRDQSLLTSAPTKLAAAPAPPAQPEDAASQAGQTVVGP